MQKCEVVPHQGGISECFPKPVLQIRWQGGRRKHRIWGLSGSNSALLSIVIC